MVSVRKILFSVFCGVLSLLIIVGILGLMQFRLTSEYNSIIEQGGKILFQFNMVREHITQSMLEENWDELESDLRGIDALNSDLTSLLDSNLLPNEYKLAIINQVDLPGLVLLVRKLKLAVINDKRRLSIQLHNHMRLMSDQLIRFDRVLAGEMKAGLVRFQNSAISVLVVIVACISLLLLFLYQKGFMPLIRLSTQLQSMQESGTLEVDAKACREVADLTEGINTALLHGRKVGSDAVHEEISPENMNSFSNHLNGIINYAQLLIDDDKLAASDAENITILEKILSSGEVLTSLIHEKQMKEEL